METRDYMVGETKRIINNVAHFEDKIKLTGFRVCNNQEYAIRSSAASLMHTNDRKTSASLRLICLHDNIVFSPPLYIDNIYHRQSIPHKNIIGFFLAPNYETRLVLVVQEESTRNINLYGIELSSVRKAHEITSLLGETHSPSVGESSNIAPSPTYSVSKSVNYFDQFLHENSSMINKLQKSDSSSVSPKSWNSKGKSDRGLEERRNISSTPTDSPMQNGFNRHSTWNSPKCGIRTPTKFPGIISSDIEYDWDDVMSPLRPKIPDDIDERISIGYYNDDTECDYSPKLSPKKTDHESDSSVPAPQNAWMENITYISNHPTKGSYVTSTGSVYMYVAQQVNPRTGSL
ncbi:hypothetical protein T265_02202 [Opisthorchis viverrini]|uniref:Trematode PH-like domain-containing protein n=1 Tax=Opisthorchis viverrini TaxID=6198 RepID=A0A074ZVR2_OPIVI|nr:hypothetical protein T265_02202 [Opisthorchis viverrini]KER31558.1 hypothetical protein T265_02202 [Opisthorchis viverrini]